MTIPAKATVHPIKGMETESFMRPPEGVAVCERFDC